MLRQMGEMYEGLADLEAALGGGIPQFWIADSWAIWIGHGTDDSIPTPAFGGKKAIYDLEAFFADIFVVALLVDDSRL